MIPRHPADWPGTLLALAASLVTAFLVYLLLHTL